MSDVELSASQEDYLETIYFLSETNGDARSKDIVERMQVRAASVTGALRALSAKGMIDYKPYGAITLTDAGRERAAGIAGKHEALLGFFTNVLGIKSAEAEDFACSMEHTIPDHIYERFVEFAAFVSRCPEFNASWQEEGRGFFCRGAGLKELRCKKCSLDADDGWPVDPQGSKK